jgi:DNA repair exonuclease SbcCD ATPase subunit
MGYLENEINSMLMSIFPGMQIKFYTNLNVDKRNMLKIKVIRQGNEVDFSEFSAGERRIFEVIFQVCLTKLFEQFSNTNINIFWFDEVLDPLDMSNSNLVVDLIKLIGEEDKTVFVISHKEHIQQLFDNKLVIESDGVNSWIGDNKKGKEKMV